MLDYPNHRYFRDYVASLNAFYLERRELWERDFTPEGFSWLLADEAEKNLVAFRRYSLDGRSIAVILNFSGEAQGGSFTVDAQERFTPVFDTGNLSESDKSVTVTRGGSCSVLNFCIPRLSGLVLECKKCLHRPSAKGSAAGKQ
jgi:1,4-alpha-glucan branching enzyme